MIVRDATPADAVRVGEVHVRARAEAYPAQAFVEWLNEALKIDLGIFPDFPLQFEGAFLIGFGAVQIVQLEGTQGHGCTDGRING